MATYCEYIFSKKKTSRDYIINVITVGVALILLHFLTTLIMFGITSLVFLLPAIWFGIIWGAIKVVRSRNIEYEYLLTECDLDVDKVICKASRKHVISVRRREIELIAPMDSDSLPSDWQSYQTIDVTSGYNPHAVYVLIANKEGKKAILFEPTEKMKEMLSSKLPRNIFHKE